MNEIQIKDLQVGKWYLFKTKYSSHKWGYELYQVINVYDELQVTLRNLVGSSVNFTVSFGDIKPIPDNWVVDKISSLQDQMWDIETKIQTLKSIMSETIQVGEIK